MGTTNTKYVLCITNNHRQILQWNKHLIVCLPVSISVKDCKSCSSNKETFIQNSFAKMAEQNPIVYLPLSVLISSLVLSYLLFSLIVVPEFESRIRIMKSISKSIFYQTLNGKNPHQ